MFEKKSRVSKDANNEVGEPSKISDVSYGNFFTIHVYIVYNIVDVVILCLPISQRQKRISTKNWNPC